MDNVPASFWTQLWTARFALLNGALVTIELALAVILLGTVIGLLGGLGLAYGRWFLRWPIRLFVDLLRGIPVLVLILFTFYGLAILKVPVSPFGAGVAALAAFCSAHVAESFRGALQSVPAGQSEAAKAIGLTFGQRLIWVVLPQALRRFLPPWINTTAEIVKGTTLISIIGVVELLLATQQAIARTYMPLQFYGVAFLIYFVVCFAIAQAGAGLERRYAYLRS
jgi:polar amino acid transport system permease protein